MQFRPGSISRLKPRALSVERQAPRPSLRNGTSCPTSPYLHEERPRKTAAAGIEGAFYGRHYWTGCRGHGVLASRSWASPFTVTTAFQNCALKSAWRRWLAASTSRWNRNSRRRHVRVEPASCLYQAAIGYVITFTLIARVEPDAWVAASFGAIPFTVGLGFFLDSTLVRRDLKASA